MTSVAFVADSEFIRLSHDIGDLWRAGRWGRRPSHTQEVRMSVMATHVMTRGAVFVHSAPASLCPHIAWALETVLGSTVRLDWTSQPCESAVLRTEANWTGEAGTGARLASALRTCENVRYDVVEEPSPGSDGTRYSFTPSLGIYHTTVSVNGDTMVNEDRLRAAMNEAEPAAFRRAVERVLGTPWDEELEPYRHAGEGATVTWLHRVS